MNPRVLLCIYIAYKSLIIAWRQYRDAASCSVPALLLGRVSVRYHYGCIACTSVCYAQHIMPLAMYNNCSFFVVLWCLYDNHVAVYTVTLNRMFNEVSLHFELPRSWGWGDCNACWAPWSPKGPYLWSLTIHSMYSMRLQRSKGTSNTLIDNLIFNHVTNNNTTMNSWSQSPA